MNFTRVSITRLLITFMAFRSIRLFNSDFREERLPLFKSCLHRNNDLDEIHKTKLIGNKG